MTNTKNRIDLILAAAVGIAAFVLLELWAFPGVHPAAWEDAAIAAGLLPPSRMIPGLGAFLSRGLFAALPFSTALAVNSLLGKILVALCGFLAYFVFAGLMTIVSGMEARDFNRRQVAIRVTAVTAATLFVCSEPVWTAAQDFSAATFVLFLLTTTAFFLVRLLVTARTGNANATLCCAGILCAESPIGWPVLVIGILVVYRYLKDVRDEKWDDFLNPVRIQHTKWSMTFLFLSIFVIGVFLEVGAYIMLDGNKANGVSYGELPSVYFSAVWDAIIGSMGLAGLCAVLFAVVIPFAIASIKIVGATDEDHYLSFKNAIVYFFVTAIAFLQVSPFEFAWFWNLAELGAVNSRVLVLVASFLSAMTVACGLYVLCVEVFCRDYKHIEGVLYQSYQDENGEFARQRRDTVHDVRLSPLRLGTMVVPLAMIVLCVFGRRLPEDRLLCSLMDAFVRETVEEVGECRYLFTDGAYDAAIRLEAKRRGKDLSPVSMMSGKSRRDAYIRQLGAKGFDDKVTLETGAAETLRTWVMSKPERMPDMAVQLAFEIFRVNRRLKPVVYGALVRPAGGDAGAAAASMTRCHRLADRIVEAHESGKWRHAKSEWIKDRFLFAQFRLAVMSRLRAINLDSEKKVKESLEEIAYSDRLNSCNPSLVKILKRMDWVRRQNGEALTPREGLEVALKRADFVMARRYAMPVLREDPDEPNANFAVGMSYYAEEQYAKAEEYLKRVLKRNPDEPAVFNNLALLYLKTGRLEEASQYAVKALKIIPDSPEAKDTARQIQKAKVKRAEEKKF